MSEKILFITGKLAERQLKRILDSMKPEFSYQINQVGVNVAALMSENILMRRLSENQNFDRIIIPGKFRGDLKRLSNYFKIPVERGPDDVSDLPDYFGINKPDNQLKDYDCEIFAEIVDAAVLPPEKIKKIAQSYKRDGANVIDLGCMPDTDFDHLEESIRAVKSIGCKVSVDSANSEELIRGSKAGADYVLSINEKNLKIMDQVKSVPIIIPSKPGNLKSLEKVVKLMIEKKQNFFADPILDPIHYGFADSVERFVKIRKKFPKIKLFMGTGNLTELTDCDSSGANAIMMGLVSELSINAVLVVQVSEHCKNSIKETDMARKIMYFSKKNQRLPFRVSDELMSMSVRNPKRKSKKEISEIKSMIKDRNYRILLSKKGINIFNNEVDVTGKDPYDFFDKLNVNDDSSHAFYLGVELARAQIALQLGKNYDQDNELDWGVAFKRKKVNFLKRPKLKTTQKSK
tara:strand:- start:660 stop:2042 length:1383 start_codon:yes stop_codon:yes gene_type:complete